VPHSPRDLELFADAPQSVHSSITHVEHTLQYPVQVVLFFFALVNSGVVFTYFEPGTWALPLAALVGRPIGVMIAASLALTGGVFLMNERRAFTARGIGFHPSRAGRSVANSCEGGRFSPRRRRESVSVER